MRPLMSFLIISICLVAVVILAIIDTPTSWVYFIPGGIGLISAFILFRSVVMPERAVARGMELIKSQDFNNRLVKVGERNADRIVTLFNTIIDKLRSERLYNREQEGLLRLLIDASPMGVVMLDFENKITLLNPSFYKICNLQKEENYVGRKIDEMKSDLVLELIKIKLGENKIIRLDPSRVYRCYHLKFIQEGFSRRFYLIESLTEEIMKAERSGYEKVIRTISHEVNNTMGGVKTVLEILFAGEEDEELKKVIGSCEERCENLSGFINSYAEVVKLPGGEMKKVDLNGEISAMLPFLEMLTPIDVKLSFEGCNEKTIVKADPVLLQQAIVNIVKNGVESMEKEGEIRIKVAKVMGRSIIEITNNGSPIRKETQEELFTPFFTTKKNGKGIGLTLVREIMVRHGADYSLRTDSDGLTRFKIIF